MNNGILTDKSARIGVAVAAVLLVGALAIAIKLDVQGTKASLDTVGGTTIKTSFSLPSELDNVSSHATSDSLVYNYTTTADAETVNNDMQSSLGKSGYTIESDNTISNGTNSFDAVNRSENIKAHVAMHGMSGSITLTKIKN